MAKTIEIVRKNETAETSSYTFIIKTALANVIFRLLLAILFIRQSN